MKTKTSNPVITSGRNVSPWLDTVQPIFFDKLTENITVDAVVIGGGISGMTTAYLLAKNNLKTAVLEDGFIGSGETGRTTAHIVNALDDRYYELEEIFDEEIARKAAQSHSDAVNFIEETVTKEKIDCNFERLDGYLFLHPSDKSENLKKEFNSTVKAGLKTSLQDSAPGIVNINPPVLKFYNQAQFHPLKYLKGLCSAFIASGGRIFTQTRANVSGNTVETEDGFKVNAKYIIVATNTPISNIFVMHTKQAPYRSYVLGLKVPKGLLPKALWWDTGDQNSTWPVYPYHYVRTYNLDDKSDLLISGGEDHKTGQADKEDIPEEDRYEKLYEWTKYHFPMAEEVLYKWSGQVMEPVDSMGFIGRNPGSENVFIATGDSGNGMTHGTLAGMIISDLIAGKDNPYTDIYDPSRKTLKTADVFLEEQLNVAKQYLKYFTPGDIDTLKEIQAGQGAIIRDNLKKLAVYRDEEGRYHTFSAVCTHLKCIVEWNNDEKTFDCPCHGSRFSCFGKVVNGPAIKDLEKEKISADASASS